MILAGINILRRGSVYQASGRLEFSALWIFQYSLTFSFVFFCHQEKLLHRNSDFHATEDNRGITQRAKRSPGKQPETGTFVFFHHHLLLLCLFCPYFLKLHADTLASFPPRSKPFCVFFFFSNSNSKFIHTFNKTHHRSAVHLHKSSFSGNVLGISGLLSNGFCNYCLFGGDSEQCK